MENHIASGVNISGRIIQYDAFIKHIPIYTSYVSIDERCFVSTTIDAEFSVN